MKNISSFTCLVPKMHLVFELLMLLSMFFGFVFTSYADLGETRQQLVARYGKPMIETKDTLRFSSKDVPVIVILNGDGKSMQEVYRYEKNVEQNFIMHILLRNSKGLTWYSTKFEDSDVHGSWHYTQSDTKVRALYESNEVGHDHVFYYLTVGL